MLQPVSGRCLALICLAIALLLNTSTVSADSQWSDLENPSDDLWADDSPQPGDESSLQHGSKVTQDGEFTSGSRQLPLTIELINMLQRELDSYRRQQSSAGDVTKRFRPSGFMGSRGKRFLPGLESLLLAKYYQDAKWKRQPHSGFHGSRG